MISIQENIPLAPLTSFRLGGEASFYVEVANPAELREALRFAEEKKIDFYVLGGGTNVLVSDKGFSGLVIRMKINETLFKDDVMEVGSGVPLIKAVNMAAEKGLSGLELLAGIPGTVGGAVRGNVGAFGSEIGDHINSVVVFNVEKGEFAEIGAANCGFGYRDSIFKRDKNLVVLSARITLDKGDSKMIKDKVGEIIAKRTSLGLHGVKSAGSYFMNPVVENDDLRQRFEKDKGVPARDNKLPAGWVIDEAGLRGKRIGGAAVSEKHANYIINTGNATAEDVITLVSYIKQQVRDKFGIQLREEVNYLGF